MQRARCIVRRAVAGLLGQRALGTVEYYLRPHLRRGLRGPFNGQEHRKAIFRELLTLFPFDAIVETGTFRGVTTQFMRDESHLPVHTVEVNARYYAFCKQRFAAGSGVRLSEGDSRSFLKRLAADPSLAGKRLFLYLDAHWYQDLPLLEEIRIVFGAWPDAIAMVDDFQVRGDPGYVYDNYGEGKALSVEYLSPLFSDGLACFFPSLPAAEETGAKTGCVVLARDAAAVETLKGAKTLRAWSPSSA